jgi:hypothetical protein
MKKLLIVLIPTLLLALGCKKDKLSTETQTETQTETVAILETTVEEDKVNITNSFENIVSCMSTMKDGDLMTAFVDFADISNGEALDEDFVEDLFENMDDAIEEIDFPEDDDRLPFESFTGTWSYKISNSTWSHVNSPSNKIIVKFPSDKYQTSNNVTASLSDYKDKKYVIDLENVWLPESFELAIFKDDVKLAELDLNDLDLEQSNDLPIPTNLDVSLYLKPFTFDFKEQRTSSKEFTAELRFDDGSNCDYVLNSKLVLAHDDYENIADEDIVSLGGFFRHNEMKMEYFLSLGEIFEIDNANDELSDDDMNNNMAIKLFMSGSKIGDITINTTSEEIDDGWGGYTETSTDFIITYKNGESDNANVYIDPFIEDLENLFESITGDFEEIW